MKSSLLIDLIRTGLSGPKVHFRKVVECVLEEKRARRHAGVASRIESLLREFRDGGVESLSKGDRPSLLDEIFDKKSLEDLVLPEGVKGSVEQLLKEYERADLLRSYGLQPRNRLLLLGPPGNGKTSLAGAIAGVLSLPLYAVRYDGIVDSLVGETALNLRKVFDFVSGRPCVLFFDELDVFAKTRSDRDDAGEMKRVTSSLLMQLDALPDHVFLVGATNIPELLDRAIWRRFQLKMTLPPPSLEGIESCVDRLQERFGLSLGCSLREVAKKLEGFSFSEAENFCLTVFRIKLLSEGRVEDVVGSVFESWQDGATFSSLESVGGGGYVEAVQLGF